MDTHVNTDVVRVQPPPKKRRKLLDLTDENVPNFREPVAQSGVEEKKHDTPTVTPTKNKGNIVLDVTNSPPATTQSTCPICGASIVGTDAELNAHVNRCLDGM